MNKKTELTQLDRIEETQKKILKILSNAHVYNVATPKKYNRLLSFLRGGK